jgi:hypothetical protein
MSSSLVPEASSSSTRERLAAGPPPGVAALFMASKLFLWVGSYIEYFVVFFKNDPKALKGLNKKLAPGPCLEKLTLESFAHPRRPHELP